MYFFVEDEDEVEVVAEVECLFQLPQDRPSCLSCLGAMCSRFQVVAHKYSDVLFFRCCQQFLSHHVVGISLVSVPKVHDHTFFHIECHSPGLCPC
jgi:hypothetical protein